MSALVPLFWLATGGLAARPAVMERVECVWRRQPSLDIVRENSNKVRVEIQFCRPLFPAGRTKLSRHFRQQSMFMS